MRGNVRSGRGAEALVLALLLSVSAEPVRAQPQNLARDCSYTMTPAPNYPATTDAGDDLQLTDGAYTAWNPIWLRPSTVGWVNAAPVTIVIDLGRVQAVSGISYSTAAGKAGVEWPRSIFVLVSDDGQRFFPVVDLANDARTTTAPPVSGYAQFRYVAGNLDTHARYVAVIVDANGPYVFADEIEVLAGDPARVGAPLDGESTTDLQDFFVGAHMRRSVQRRLTIDLVNARSALASSSVPPPVRDRLSQDLDAIQSEIAAVATPDPGGFTPVLPLNDLHTRIFAVHGAIAGASGLAPLAAWPANPWDFVRPLDKPPAQGARDTVTIAAMNGETRAGAITISSSLDRPAIVSVGTAGLAVDADDSYLQLFEVVWTDTRELIPVADALLPLDRTRRTFVLPAGMTRQIWLTFTPGRRPPGTCR